MKMILSCLLISMFILSCGRASKEKASDGLIKDLSLTDTKQEEKSMAPAANAVDSAATSASVPNVLQAGQPVTPDWDKKIIKTAKVTLELTNYSNYNSALHGKLKAYGAYIAQENQNENDFRIQNDMTIKVPVDQFDNLMNTLNGEGIKVLEKNISSEDVTGEVVDTKARIEAKKQVRARYLELLKQAKNMEEILQVQNEINEIQENLEAASGRVAYLTHAASYSTIKLSFYQYINGSTEKDITPSFVAQAGEAFKTGASVIINLVLFFISIWPITIAGILLIFYLRKWKTRRRHLPGQVH